MAIEPEEERPHMEEDEGGPVKSFLEHLEDLRWVLIKSITTLAVAMLICLIGGNYVVAILKHPLEKAQVRYSSDDRVAILRYGTNRLATWSLDLDQWDALNAGTNLTFWRFATNDIVDLKTLARKLQNPSKSDTSYKLSQFLDGKLSAGTQKLLTNYLANLLAQTFWQHWRELLPFYQPDPKDQENAFSTDLRAALVSDFNRLIAAGPLYDADRFEGIDLPQQTALEVKQNLQGADLERLNGRLLLNAYHEKITKNTNHFVAFQLLPKSDGTNIMLGLRPDQTVDAGKLARQVNVDLNTLSPAGGFFVAFQVAFYAGMAVSSPFLFYFICQFIFPALKWKEKRYIYRGMAFFIPLFLIGANFCYWVLMPVALAASQLYSKWLGLSASIWNAEDYISFVSKFVLGMGLGFEMPVVILVLVKIGVLNYSILSKGRRYMIIINLVLGALLTTPEVLTQVLMAIPLQFLYEVSIWIAWYWERQEKQTRGGGRRRNPARTSFESHKCSCGKALYKRGFLATLE